MALQLISSPEVQLKFDSYPEKAKNRMKHLRSLILDEAELDSDILRIEETLKWGEPSYKSPNGTVVRIDYKDKNEGYFGMYFQCSSQMIPSIKALFGDLFHYEKTRALIFHHDDVLPEKALTRCINMALNYHNLKHLSLLGQ